jgi:YHS domain-containing protein
MLSTQGDSFPEEGYISMTKDPVCGMQVDEKKAAASSSYQGKNYSFCSQDCKTKFDRDPQHYAQSQQKDRQQQPQEHVQR